MQLINIAREEGAMPEKYRFIDPMDMNETDKFAYCNDVAYSRSMTHSLLTLGGEWYDEHYHEPYNTYKEAWEAEVINAPPDTIVVCVDCHV